MEYCIGDLVRFKPCAEVSAHALRHGAVVTGYECVDDKDYVVVEVLADVPYEQWALPRELAPALAGEGEDREREFSE